MLVSKGYLNFHGIILTWFGTNWIKDGLEFKCVFIVWQKAKHSVTLFVLNRNASEINFLLEYYSISSNANFLASDISFHLTPNVK